MSRFLMAAVLTAGLCGAALNLTAAEPGSDPLQQAFLSPPNSAQPRVWWHWMNGNVTKEGIKLDLEWMKRVGIGGMQNFDAALFTPKIVDQRLVFMTPAWNDAFRYTATLADQLGLELAIAGSPGWSESGGPWVKPEQAMKKLVWSETRVLGGRPFKGRLPQPPSEVGPFQNVRKNWSISIAGAPPAEPVPNLYRDVAVIAYRLPESDRVIAELRPKVTSSIGEIDSSRLWDNDLNESVALPIAGQGQVAWIQLDCGSPQTVQSMSLALQDRPRFAMLVDPAQKYAELLSSRNGIDFFPVAAAYNTVDLQQTISFAPVTARYFRLVLPTLKPTALAEWLSALIGPPSQEHKIAELVLHASPRAERFEQKAGYFVDEDTARFPTRSIAARDTLEPGKVLDLTSKLGPDGSLAWTVPAGQWAVLRLGYSLLGVTNHPAAPDATGLEVDKLNQAHVKAHMESYLGRYESILGPQLMGRRGLHAMVNDSYEAGPQNWTDDLPAQFARRRGYDMHPWMPALIGRIVRSASATDQFLWDFRRTLGELIAENHYEEIASVLHERGMTHYAESHEGMRAYIGDGMDAKRNADVPMSAMWVGDMPRPQEIYDADIRESASVAHIYGQNLVAAESLTVSGMAGNAFALAPEDLKPTADRELANGLNRFVIHTSVHQPLENPGPGFTLGPFGQFFTRHETWAEQAKPWMTYLARSSHLLQQGRFVADVLYFYGQDSSITSIYSSHLPPVPEGYAFDFANPHALTMLAVENGQLTTQSGMRYRVLALDPRAKLMSLDVLRQIARLVFAGAMIVGEKPQATPSLADNGKDFQELADKVWSADHVVSGKSLSDALAALNLAPDFSYTKLAADSKVWFVHRQLPDGDLYFINNRQSRPERIEARFRVTGKAAELWHADTGVIKPVSYRMEGDQTAVPLELAPRDAVFVMFRESTQQRERTLVKSTRQTLASIQGPWQVSFPANRGAPNRATFTELKSWSVNANAGIKYFSGTATYEKALKVPATWLAKGQRVQIALGEVKNLAEVFINGKSCGIAWQAPFTLDITDALKPGSNRLQIRVTNLWPNRLIGDKQPGAQKIAFSTFDPYKADSPLLPSGLLGPVSVVMSAAAPSVAGASPAWSPGAL
jgi:hypothetical protein